MILDDYSQRLTLLCRVELMFVLLIRYIKSIRLQKLGKTAEKTAAAAAAHSVAAKPVTTA